MTAAKSETADVAAPSPNDTLSSREAKTVVDASVTQGNRLKTQAQMDPTHPVAELEAKIRGHFDQATLVLGSMRAAADELEALLNKLRVGI